MSEFSRQDLESPLWARLRRHFEARVDLLRRQNDANLDAIETAELRGRIREAKAFLSIGEAPEFVAGTRKPIG